MTTGTQHHDHGATVPRGALLGAAVLLLASIALAGAARSSRIAEAERAATRAPTPALAALDVRFEDRAGGALVILDAESGKDIATVAPGTNGFVRGVLRGMFRTRKLESLGKNAVFRLAREADGRLTLTDPESGRRIDLDSFGPTNSESFAGLLEAGLRARTAPTTAMTMGGAQ